MFSWMLAKRIEKENRLKDREYHLLRMYHQMVKFACQFMTEEEKHKWLEFHDPEKTDGNISLILGGTEWAYELDPRKINYEDKI